MSNHTVAAAAEGMPEIRGHHAAIEALSRCTDAERPELIEAFVETLSEAEVQAIGAELDARADRSRLVTLLDRISPEARKELLAYACKLEAEPEFLTLHVNPSALRHLSIAEVSYLGDALRTLREVTTALCCQPRFQSERRGQLNAAGGVIEALYDLASNCLGELREEMNGRSPDGREEAKMRSEYILMDQVLLGDDLDQLEKVYASLYLHQSASKEAGR